MRLWYGALWMLAVVGLSTAAILANEVSNPGFENDATPADDWPDNWMGTATYKTEPEYGASAHTGTDYMRAASNGGHVVSTVLQSVGLPEGPAGYELTLSFWAWLYDEGGAGDSLTGEIIVDGVCVASITMTGPLGQYTLKQVTWSGAADTDITVVFTLDADGTGGWGVVALDDVELAITPDCGTGQHEVTDIDPISHGNDDDTTGATINGSDLDNVTGIRLVKSGAEIVGENLGAAPDGLSLTLDLPTRDAQPGTYHVIVEQTDCAPRALIDGFQVFDTMMPNLLVNGRFENPPVPYLCPTQPAQEDHQPVTAWLDPTTASGQLEHRNGTVWRPQPCPRDPGGDNNGVYATGQWAGWTHYQYYYQNITGLTPGQNYEFAGWWFLGVNNPWLCRVEAWARLYNGHDPDPGTDTPIAQDHEELAGISGSTGWLQFSATGAPSGSDMAVLILWHVDAGSGKGAVHATQCSLRQRVCTAPPAVTGISPTYGVRNTPPDIHATISGSNFVAGRTTVKLTRPGQADIQATGVVVTGGGSSLSCDFDLTGSPAVGRWDLAVEVNEPGDYCPEAILPSGFLIAAEAFSNGSFELPAVGGGCPVTPVPDVPTGWQFSEVNAYGHDDALFRDSDRFAPTCPPPGQGAGSHYGSSISDAGGSLGPAAVMFQNVAATPDTAHTFSGFFAGGGENDVSIELRDGDETGPALGGTAPVWSGKSTDDTYDWTFFSVTRTPAPGIALITPLWEVAVRPPGYPGEPPHAAHADDLRFGPCATPPTVNGPIAPNSGHHDAAGPLTGVTIAGTGFDNTPGAVQVIVQQNCEYAMLFGENVSVSGPGTLITFDLDTRGAPLGAYDVIVRQNACVVDDALEGAFTVTCSLPASTVSSIDPGGEAGPTSDSSFTMTLNGTNLDQLTGVKLVRAHGGAEIAGTLGAAGPGATRREATFDLTTAEMGRYDLEFEHPCPVDPLERAFLVYVAEPSNISFETGTAMDPPGLPCPPPGSGYDESRPRHWDEPAGQQQLNRNGSAHLPPCPLPDGDHYATLGVTGGPNTLSCFQTFAAAPGELVVVTARFAGATSGEVHAGTFKMLDGDENSTTVLAATSITNATTLAWGPEALAGRPSGNRVTLVVEMNVAGSTSDTHALHIDGIEFPCNDPFADVPEGLNEDGDGDVDMDDFALWQRCYAGLDEPIPDKPAYCLCLDVSGPGNQPDGHVEVVDLAAFERCWSGPGIAADQCCDGGEGCP